MSKADVAEITMPEDQPKQAPQPLFFQSPVPIDKDKHAKAGLKRAVGFDFARDANSVPVNVHEFVELARSYPIVFTAEPVPMPIVVLGLRNENRFVGADGKWLANHYVPAYVRKYPFALFEVQDQDKFILCVDEKSAHFKAKKPDLAFYDDKGEASEVTNQAVEMCGQYHSQHRATVKFAEAIRDAGILEPKELKAEMPDGKAAKIGGFLVPSEDKWQNVPDATVLEWRKNKWLGLVYLVLASQANWKYLANYEA